MGVVRFYHLTRDPVAPTLARLLRRALDANLRVEIRGTDADKLAHLDEALWLGDEAEFLPHGVAGEGDDARQPILLTLDTNVSEQANCLFCVDGASVDPEEVNSLDRVLILFDGGNESALADARGQWKHLTAEGAEAEYWSQESGSWEMKARS